MISAKDLAEILSMDGLSSSYSMRHLMGRQTIRASLGISERPILFHRPRHVLAAPAPRAGYDWAV